MAAQLRLGDIQGNITPGFRKDYQAFVLVRFPDRQAGRRWLSALGPHVASAEEVASFLHLFRLVRRRRPGDETRVAATTWINVAVSWSGLERLGAPGLDAFPAEFRTGHFRWSGLSSQAGGPAPRAVDALLLLAADLPDQLDAELRDQRGLLERCGVVEVGCFRGGTLPGPQRGQEHFGFRDGISQPAIQGAPDVTAEATIPPGEFILGYPNLDGMTAVNGPAWARDGSYLVLWRLRQDVAAFRAALAAQAPRVGLSPDQLAAKVVGRWASGALPSRPIQARDPGWDAAGPISPHAAELRADPRGERLPLWAHIRKAHPLDHPDASRHRLLRRGIPYGDPLPPGAADDGQDRGLLFLAYQASIARQFEHVQRQWLDNAQFPVPGTGADALVGQARGGRDISLVTRPAGQQTERRVHLSLPAFVTPTAGGYFFAPSLPALRELARPAGPRPQPRPEGAMSSEPRNLSDLLGEAVQRWIESIVSDKIDGNSGPAWRGTPDQNAWPTDASASATLDPGQYTAGYGQAFDYTRFVQQENPYGADSVQPTGPIDIIGPAAQRNASDPLRKGLAQFTPYEVDACARWTFRDQTYRVTKAIRIPYRYRSAADGREIEAHILIGFQGPGY